MHENCLCWLPGRHHERGLGAQPCEQRTAELPITDLDAEGLWCKRGGLLGYAGARNWETLAMVKLENLKELFAGLHFDREVIILCVHWYLRFKLSLRDLVKMMAERGLSLAHTTTMRRVRHYSPEFEKRLCRYALAIAVP
jgi:hypothetical protein